MTARLLTGKFGPGAMTRAQQDAQHRAKCAQCGVYPVAFDGARFCGAACTLHYESPNHPPCGMCGSTSGTATADDGLERCRACGCH
jgi:hypothetical protein